jgi:hypothetical protein
MRQLFPRHAVFGRNLMQEQQFFMIIGQRAYSTYIKLWNPAMNQIDISIDRHQRIYRRRIENFPKATDFDSSVTSIAQNFVDVISF